MIWPTKKLGEIAEVIMGQSPPSSSYNERGEGLPFFQGKAEFGEIYPTPVKYCSSPSRIVEENDILISVRAPVGNINIAREKSCVGRGLGALRAKKNILNQMFLFYFMKKNENNWSRLSTGSTFSAIKGSALKNFEIPLPPLATQKQIVERLDKIAEGQKLNDDLIQKSDELFQSLLHKELNPAGRNWEIKELQEIVEARSGFGFSMEIQGKTDGEIPFYKVSDMNLAGNQIEMVYHNNTITTKQCVDRRYKPAPKGTIIFPKIGAAVATNKKRILTRDSLYDNNVMGLIPTAEILSEYLFFWMLRFDISLWASQSMPPSIKKSTVDKFTISLPKLEIQKQIVAKLSATQEYKTQLLAQKSKLKELFNSALAKSFNGQV